MAEATRDTRVDYIPQETEVVRLELTNDEAQMLVDVLSRVGGSPERSRRGLARDVLRTLEDLGFAFTPSVYPTPFGTEDNPDCDITKTSSITFKEDA